MDTNDLQKSVNDVFVDAFGHSSLRERHADILNEAIELTRSVDIRGLKEETGDLLCSVIQSCSENGWTVEDVVQETLTKINRRKKQYHSLGRKRKVAIYGGAFDMIHKGHISVSKIVLNHSSDYDEVWLTPCFQHLYGKKLTDAQHRLEMCRIAAKVDARIKVFDYEIRNEFQGETYHFMKKLMNDAEFKDKYSFSLIIGLDNANTIEQWSNYEDLTKMVPFIVVRRQAVEFKADWCLQTPHRYLDPDDPPECVSSTYLRELVKNHDLTEEQHIEIRKLMDMNVYEYALNNNLY